jgi:hypothetical protein
MTPEYLCYIRRRNELTLETERRKEREFAEFLEAMIA